MCGGFDPIFYLPQDFDRIAEANELFDAVLTGSVDQDKTATADVLPSNQTPAKDKPKLTAGKDEKTGNPRRRLALYIGNFSWVSKAHCECQLKFVFYFHCLVSLQ